MVEAVVAVALRAILASILLGSVLAALVFLATRYLALNAATRHALWTTALIATAVMPLAGVGVSVYRATATAHARPPADVTPSTTRRTGAGTTTVTEIRRPAPDAGTRARERRGAGTPTSPVTAPRAAASSRSLGEAALERLSVLRWTPRMSRAIALGIVGVWALGAVIGLVGLGASLLRVRGLKRRSSPLDGSLADELPWLTEVGPGREIYLRLSFETETPVAIGFRRPVILIPTELATADGLEAIEQLVLHEYAHLRRFDDWTNLVQRTIERVFWFNPIVWVVGRRIALEREIASDDAVVERTGEPHAYATSLWRLAREMRMPEHAVVAPGALLTRKQITVRIEQLLDKKNSRLHRSPVAAAGVSIAAIAAVAVVATSAPAVELSAQPEAALTVNVAHDAGTWRHVAVRHTAGAPRTETAVALKPLRPARDANVTPLEQKTVRFEVVPMPTVAPQLHASAVRSLPDPARVVKVDTSVRVRPVAPGIPPSEETVQPPAPPAPAKVIVSAAPGSVTVNLRDGNTLTPEQIAKLQSIATSVAARITRERGAENVTPYVTKALRSAFSSLPREVAEETTWNSRTRFDGVKVSRELIASCIACSFRNADLRGVDLHGLKLNGIDLSGADMRGANLAGAQLVGVSLAGANLSKADLRNAELKRTDLRGANLDGAQLEGIKLIGSSVKTASMKGTAMRSVLANCTGCDLSRVDLRGQDLRAIVLNGADLSHANLAGANLSGVRFVGVDLSHANLTNADLTNARFEGCDVSHLDLRGARTTGITMTGSSVDD